MLSTLNHVPIGGRHLTAAENIQLNNAGVTFSSDDTGWKRSELSCCEALKEVVSHIRLDKLGFFEALTQSSMQCKSYCKKATIITAMLPLNNGYIDSQEPFVPTLTD